MKDFFWFVALAALPVAAALGGKVAPDPNPQSAVVRSVGPAQGPATILPGSPAVSDADTAGFSRKP